MVTEIFGSQNLSWVNKLEFSVILHNRLLKWAVLYMPAWKQGGFHFESGPSLYSGMASRGRGANPLAHVLAAIEEPLELLEYKHWNLVIPEGHFLTEVGTDQMEHVVRRISGESGVAEWRSLQRAMKPLSKAACTTPAAAIRLDVGNHLSIAARLGHTGCHEAQAMPTSHAYWDDCGMIEPLLRRGLDGAGAALTVLVRYLPQLATSGLDSLKLLRPFSEVTPSL